MSFLILRALLRKRNLVSADIKAVNIPLSIRTSFHDHAKPIVSNDPNAHLPFKPYTLDDLPVPEGDYYEDYKKKNRKYWRHLIFGVTYLAATIYVLVTKDWIMWNAFPPELPPKEERIKSFWVEPEDDDDDDDDE